MPSAFVKRMCARCSIETCSARILTCQAAAREMMPRLQGRIVTIGLVAAFKGSTNGSIYAVAKAGMTHYARCLATRTGRFIGTPAVDQVRMVETCTLDRIATVEESPPQPGVCSIFEYVLSP
jgi:NADP-dependent 3-hydroxy acid dehydrogenase YdfG